MTPLKAFLQLIRWPNLLFIAITQLMFHFFVVVPSATGEVHNFPLRLTTPLLLILCLASVLIAAGGYIINDYFDVNIDQVNKPHKIVIGKYISRRHALLQHMLLSGIGVLLTAVVAYQLGNWLLVLANLGCTMLLWYYSTNYKRQLLVGNVLISAMIAWVILVMLVAEVPGWWTGELITDSEKATVARLTRIGLLYAGFAFVINLIREVVKDLEDMEGDRREGCTTMPIRWGVPATKVFVGMWMLLLAIALVITQIYVIFFEWWYSAVYIIVLVVLPLLHAFQRLTVAHSMAHFAALSKRIKWIMLFGILSMAFFMLYTH